MFNAKIDIQQIKADAKIPFACKWSICHVYNSHEQRHPDHKFNTFFMNAGNKTLFIEQMKSEKENPPFVSLALSED